MSIDIERLMAEEATLSRQELWALLEQLEQDSDARYQEAAERIAQRLRQLGNAEGSIALEALPAATRIVREELAALANAQNTMLEEGLLLAAALGLRAFDKRTLEQRVASKKQLPATERSGLILRIELHNGSNDSHASARKARTVFNDLRQHPLPDGLRLSDRLWRVHQGAERALLDMLNAAVIRGWDAETTLRNFMDSKGNISVSPAVYEALGQARAEQLAKTLRDGLLNVPGNPRGLFRRVLRTEINRYHGKAYMREGAQQEGFKGFRFRLSPSHRVRDVCDTHATVDQYGLGSGVYPDEASCPWPAHPNTLSYVEVVFEWETG